MALTAADDALITRIRASLGDDILRDAAPRYLEEPRDRWRGTARFVALPRTTDEVAAVMRLCAQARVPVVPYGGGTGLVGGQVAEITPTPLLISLERMTRIRALYPEENVVVAEAGVILSDLHDAVQEVDRLFPLSLASKGSARLGGLLATNAGGINTLRYGNARDQVLGLEAVMADGQVWHGLKRLRKDNSGYDLRNLLVGSEGTLGIITAATLKLSPVPAAVGTAFFAVRDPSAALSLLSLARDQLGDSVSAFELINRMGFDFLSVKLPEIRRPWDDPPEWCVLVEVGLMQGIDPQEALATLFEAAHDAGLVSDGLIAQSQAQADDFWSVREHIPEANRRIGAVSSHDISVPLSEIAQFIPRATQALARLGQWRINCFGHLGDGNLHYNVFPVDGESRADHEDKRDAIKACVHDVVHDMGGSVSAEHGIGRLKVGDLEKYGDPVKLATMRAIKTALDPNGILNPGAVLRDQR